MELLKAIKFGADLVTNIGVGTIVGGAVGMVTPWAGIHVVTKACVGVGSFILGSMLSDQATKYTEGKIDQVNDAIQEVKDNLKEA